MASEDSGSTRFRSFLLIVRTGRIFTAWQARLVAPDTRSSQHIASCTRGIASARGRPGPAPGLSTLGPL
jgi:hypothetical protein